MVPGAPASSPSSGPPDAAGVAATASVPAGTAPSMEKASSCGSSCSRSKASSASGRISNWPVWCQAYSLVLSSGVNSRPPMVASESSELAQGRNTLLRLRVMACSATGSARTQNG